MHESEFALLKELSKQLGYRIEVDNQGVERIYRPDGALAAEIVPQQPFIPPMVPRADMPADVTLLPSGSYCRVIAEPDPVTGGTNTIQEPVCEDCWEVIPSYVDFPHGLTSPESDGDAGGNGAKTKVVGTGVVSATTGQLIAAVEHLPKIVCLRCYYAAFHRVYPEAPLPELRADVLEKRLPVVPPIEEVAQEPKGPELQVTA